MTAEPPSPARRPAPDRVDVLRGVRRQVGGRRCSPRWSPSCPSAVDPALLVGLAPFDDAAIYRIDDTTALVSTTDFFPPLVDDPADYGAIAAANACSDVFAMGGRVVLAINVAAFPEHFPRPAMATIFAAAAAVVAEAGGTVAGGHTIRNPEPVFGLAVQGLVHPDRVFRKGGARPGDVVVLSKPLGTGLTLAGGERRRQGGGDRRDADAQPARRPRRCRRSATRARRHRRHRLRPRRARLGGRRAQRRPAGDRQRRAGRLPGCRRGGRAGRAHWRRRPQPGLRRRPPRVDGVGDGRGAGARPPDVGWPAGGRRPGGRRRADRRRVLARRHHRGRASRPWCCGDRRPHATHPTARLEEAGADAGRREGDVGPRPRGGRRHRRGRSRRVGRSADGRRGDPASRHAGQRGPRLQAAHREGAREAVRPAGGVVRGVGRRQRVAGRVRRARDVGRPEAGRVPGHRAARRDPRRRRRRRQLGLRVAARRPRRPADQGRRPLPQRRRGVDPRQGGPRPRDARAGRALPQLVVRHQQGLSVPGAQGGAAGLRPVGHPPPHLGVHGPLRPVVRHLDGSTAPTPTNPACSTPSPTTHPSVDGHPSVGGRISRPSDTRVLRPWRRSP